MVARQDRHKPAVPAAGGTGASTAPAAPATVRATPLLPALALMNVSALIALAVLLMWPVAFDALRQMMLLLSVWLLINLLVVVLVRLIDSGRSGAASVNLSR